MFLEDKEIITINRTAIVSQTLTMDVPAKGLEAQELQRTGLTLERYARYKRLLDSLGLAWGISRDGETIYFAAELPSLLNRDSTKGYVYSPATTMSPCVDNLDRYVPTTSNRNVKGGYIVFKTLQPHWFLYRAWE